MFEIYSEVRAILSANVINAIEGCVIDTVKQCVVTASVEQITSENGTHYLLCGTLDGILIAKSKLEELLNSLHLKRLAKESSERDSTTFSEENSSIADEGNTSYDKEGTDKTSCLSDDKERDTNASSNGYVSTNTESSVKTLRLKPLSKKLRFILKERPRFSQRSRSARLALQLRTLKKKSIVRNKPLRPLGLLQNDPDKLSENLQQMKLVTEDSDFDSTEQEVQGSKVPADNVSPKEKDYEANSPYKHFCELCSFKTKRSSHFMKHMAIHEKVSTLHRCSHCTFTSVRLNHLRRHEMSHSSTVHNCTECHYKTDDAKFLMRHIKLKHHGFQNDKNSPVVLSCPHCSYQTTKQHYYDRHQRMHCSKRNFLHQCEQCCYKTHRKEHLVRHVNNVHGNKRPFLCHLCGKAFKRGDALLQHYQTHSEIVPSENSSFKCNVCEKTFRSHSHLLEHQAVHSDTRSILCEMCGASFKTRSVHRKHVLSIHRNPRAYSCDSCTKRFNTLFALKRHQKTHMLKNNPQPCATGAEVDSSKELETALTNLRTCYEDPTMPSVTIPNATVVQPVNPPVDTVTLDIASVPVPEVPATNAELLQHFTPALFQNSDTAAATTLLYLTRHIPQL